MGERQPSRHTDLVEKGGNACLQLREYGYPDYLRGVEPQLKVSI